MRASIIAIATIISACGGSGGNDQPLAMDRPGSDFTGTYQFNVDRLSISCDNGVRFNAPSETRVLHLSQSDDETIIIRRGTASAEILTDNGSINSISGDYVFQLQNSSYNFYYSGSLGDSVNSGKLNVLTRSDSPGAACLGTADTVVTLLSAG